MLLGLLLVGFVAVMAQQTPQTGEQKKQAEACCAMESCCCKGDSCSMKKEGTETGEAKEDCCGDSCKLHHENAKNSGNDPAKTNNENAKSDSASPEGCCAESCDMSKHEKHDKKTHSSDGSCCKMKQKDAKKQVKSN
jgi:hypothetical protein